MKKNIGILSLLILILGLTGCVNTNPTAIVDTMDPLDAAYDVSTQVYIFEDGRHVRDNGDIFTIFGDPVKGHLDGSKADDYAVIIKQEIAGASGEFYSISAAVGDDKEGKLMGTRSLFLGDRIAVTGVRIEDKTIVVDYLDRNEDQADEESPTVPVTKSFEVDGDLIEEID